KRTSTVWEMIKIHVANGPYFQGTVSNYPQIVVKKTDMQNVPTKDNLALGGFVNPWIHPTPAVYDTETYYWNNPDQHKI
ncbi:MAG TPA: ABC transporter substrate-binding protein, partial [Propionibacteriaceae bacterium]